MAPKLFLTGVTGYIGGDALYTIYNAHPDWHYTALVRNSDKGALVAKDYPAIRLVYGDLASVDLLEAEARRADIVLHFADADDETSAKALAKGLAGHTPSAPGFWIHTSGTGVLMYHDMDRNVFGDDHPKLYDDIADIDELNSLPDRAPHRSVDKIVQQAASDSVRTAIVCPPTIYDHGRGPGNQRSIQIPGLSRAMIERGQAFFVGKGKTFWGNVNVHDLSNVYLLLATAAAEGGGKASWGHDGYYFAENGEHVWGDISRHLGRNLHQQGVLKSSDAVSITADEATKMHWGGGLLWGANSRARASRIRKELGWSPTGRPIEATLNDACDMEKRALDASKAGV